MKIRNKILGAGLVAAAAGASALSLGPGRGAVLIGSSVDLSFDIQPDAGADVASSCVAVTASAGDFPIPEAAIRVTPLPEMRGRSPAVRVQIARPMDEPVLSVRLSAGCSGRITRSYTFLADLPGTTVSTRPQAQPVADVSPRAPDVPAIAAPVTARALAGSSGDVPMAPRPAASSPRTDKHQAATLQKRAPKEVPLAAQPKRPFTTDAKAERSRLVVEPLEVWSDRPIALKSSPLLADPSPAELASSPRRAEAAALWKALNQETKDTQSLLKEAERLNNLETEVQADRSRRAADAQQRATLEARLQELEQERFSATVVYVLAGLLALVLAALGWLWRRVGHMQDGSRRSWTESVARTTLENKEEAELVSDLLAHPDDEWTPSITSPLSGDGDPADAGPSTVMVTPPAPAPVVASAAMPAPVAVAPAFASPQAADLVKSLDIVTSDEWFDVQQQAEFFVSVGEHDQAIDVLRDYIRAHSETAPHAYIELLNLYHSLGRREDFEQLRDEFARHFNGRVPDFAQYKRGGRYLDDYADILAAIEAIWSTDEVETILEAYVFKQKAGSTGAAAFDMPALDDLLMLLAIAQTTPAKWRGAPPPRQRTTPVPQTFESAAATALDDLELAPDFVADPLAAEAPSTTAPATASAHLGLDFDLGDLSLAPSAPMPMPAVDRVAMPQPAALELRLDPASASPVSGGGGHHPAAGLGAPLDLDLDLSDPPHITLSELPPVVPTPAPSQGQMVGFGMENDLMELSLELELEQRKPKP